MSLSSGDRVGLYEIVGPLGAGGTGEVYRARDTKPGREVAIRVLPADVAQDAGRLARFKRGTQLRSEGFDVDAKVEESES